MPSDDLFAGLFVDLSGPEIPSFPASNEAGGSEQDAVNVDVSRRSHCSHAENGGSAFFERIEPETRDFCPAGSRASSYRVSEVGRAGNVGTASKTLAASDTSLFPLPSISVRKEEEEWEQSTPEPDLPIPASRVRAAVEREVVALAALDVDGPEANVRAVAIVRVKVGNSEVLAERQQNGAACHVCGARLDDDAPVIAVLSGKPNSHLYMHAACHDTYRIRRQALVDRLMAAAGFPSEVTP